MKVYELMNLLSVYPAGKDVTIVNGEKQFVPYEADDADGCDLTLPIVIFAKVDK